ncbi:hypothetical protein ABZ617_06125 [Nocardiopsis alba]|uniref:hypothetical protein n=1 Tax=Nocardiopsis alba TaxID=53437 RepID=UPI0033E8CFC6
MKPQDPPRRIAVRHVASTFDQRKRTIISVVHASNRAWSNMSQSEFIWVAAELEDVLNEIRKFPESTLEKKIIEGDFQFQLKNIDPDGLDIAIEIESDETNDEYPTILSIQGSRWSDAPEKVQAFFDLMTQRTNWGLASRLNNENIPLTYREPLA